ncbi:MAG: hypothetical protein QXV64_02400 [Candidatus Anstonellaceae archaeon]
MQKVSLLKNLQENKKYFVFVGGEGVVTSNTLQLQKKFFEFFNKNDKKLPLRDKNLPDAPGGIGF